MSYRPEHWENMRQQLKQLGVTRICCYSAYGTAAVFKCWDTINSRRLLMPCSAAVGQVVLTSGPAADEMAWVWMLLHAAVRQNRLLVWRVKLAFLN